MPEVAVNAITIQYAKTIPGIRNSTASTAGDTNTDLNGRTGSQTVEEGAAIIVAEDGAERVRERATTTFITRADKGPAVPW